MKKKALGKGLKAFIPEEYGILKEERYLEIDISQLKPNPFQPRQNFNSASIDDLAKSIKESGILQPIVVAPENDHYRIIIGERRWRAAQKLGLVKIPALVRPMSQDQQLEVSLVENLQREDLNPIEIAQAYHKMTQELNLTQQDIADKVGKDRTSISNYLRLLKLPEKIQNHIETGKISMGHARALIALDNPALQLSICAQILQKNLSVRQVEHEIQRIREKSDEKKPLKMDPNLKVLQEEILKILGTKVLISGNSDKGVVKIYYFSTDDLNRIFEKIKGACE